MRESLLRRIVLACLTGILYPFCFPDHDLGWLAWVVLVPLHLALDGAAPRRAFWLGWLTGLIAFVGTMSWVVTAMHLYGKLPETLSYAVMLLLTAYLGLYVAIYAVGVSWIRKTAFAFIGAPFIWVALEWLRTYLFSGLPWALLGYSQYRWLPVIQIADHTGVYGVSFLVALVNAALADAALWTLERFTRQNVGTFPVLSPGAAVLAMAITLLYGLWYLGRPPHVSQATPTISIGLVQANIDQAHKWDVAYRRETLDRYARLTARAADGTALVIWPEAATPFLFEQEPEYRDEITALVRKHNIPLLFGSPALRHYPNGRPYLLNSAYLLSTDGRILGRYDKRHLVPFGEYVPARRVLYFLDKLVEGIGDFESGTIPAILEVPLRSQNASGRPLARFGVVICYEVIFPNLVREFAGRGAEFMVTITNDAWYGVSSAPFQHFGMVVMRAVENRVSFARAANTGVSGFIDPQGRVLLTTPIFEEQGVTGQVPLGRPSTFYTKRGDVFAYACAIISGLLLLGAQLTRSPSEWR